MYEKNKLSSPQLRSESIVEENSKKIEKTREKYRQRVRKRENGGNIKLKKIYRKIKLRRIVP